RFLRVYIDRVPSPGGSGAGSGQAGTVEQAIEAPSPFPVSTHGLQVQTLRLGISHADCEAVSKQLSVILDVEELVPGPGYELEVSSPGMDRALTKAADFERFAGRLAKISMIEPVGQARFFEGRLKGFAEGKVRMELKGKAAQMIELPIENIRKANLVV